MRKRFSILLAMSLLLVQPAARPETVTKPAGTERKRVETISWGPVEVTITATPSRVRYDRDVLLTVRVSSPKGVEVQLPALVDRLNGFILTGEYEGEPFMDDNRVIIEHHARLTPTLSEEHRIAPMAIVFKDTNRRDTKEEWFPTRPIVFETEEIGPTGDGIKEDMEPLWIRPSLKEAGLAILALALALAACWLLFRIALRFHREAQLRKMSPRERALKELEILLARHLPEKDMVKEFYIDLTMIVRKYIERQHSIQAPEQTTEEFLQAVSTDPRFKGKVLSTLRDFLEAADLVKFAAHQPDGKSIDSAVHTARTYITTDSEEERQNV